MDKNLHINFEQSNQHILDDAFVRWAKGVEQNEGYDYKIQYGADIEKKAIIEAKYIVKNMIFAENVNTNVAQQRVWSKLTKQIENQKTTKYFNVFQHWKTMSVAAASIIALVGMFFLYNQAESPTIISNSVASKTHHQLPDNSKVVLNAESKIEYTKNSFLKSRELTLLGEAFFEVEKGKEFKVNTSQGSVEVLGTSFNVYSRNNGFRVVCRTGKVRVVHRGTVVVLTPGQVYPNSVISEESEWISGNFYFRERKLSEVWEEVERQFDIDIKMDTQLDSITFTGVFSNKNLKEAIYQICWPLDLNFVIKDKVVAIEAKK